MPNSLPSMLSPRCIVDDCIEIELRLQPPSSSPYRLTGFELEELRQQSIELIDVGFIRFSRSLYSAPTFF